jgi:iron complex outermembrane receptor protein
MHLSHFPRRTLLANLILALSCGVVFAEDEAVPIIEVTAQPIPGMGEQLVPAAGLDERGAASSDSAGLLRGVPGVSLQTGGGVSALPGIRGLADDRLRIKVDGMDLISACGNHMNPPLSYIDPNHVETIEVFAGIAPVSLGGDSIGGTIAVESTSPRFAEAGETLQAGELGLFYRSNGNERGGNLGLTLATETVSLDYRGSTVTAEDYRAGDDFKAAGPAAAGRGWLDGDEVGSSMYESTNHALTLALRSEDHLLELKGGIQDIPYQGWVNQRMDMTGNDSTHLNLRYQGSFEWGDLVARGYRESTRHAMQFHDDKLFWYGPNMSAPETDGIPHDPVAGMNGYAGGMPMDTKGDNRGLTLRGDLLLAGGNLLRIGGELQRYRLDDWWEPSGKGMWPNTFWNIRDGERDRLALFGEWEAEWSRRWQTQIGLRHETVEMDAGEVQGYNTMSAEYAAESAAFNAADRSRRDRHLDLTALARFTPNDATAIEFGFARKSRSPNLYERYTWSTGGMAMRMINMAGDGNGYVGNLDLEPETAHTLSAAFEWQDGDRWQLRLAPYFTKVDDYIDARRCESANMNCGPMNQTAEEGFVYLQFVNQDARLYGFDLSAHYQLTKGNEYGALTLSALVNQVRGENRTTGDNLYNIMPLNGQLALAHELDGWRNSLELELVDGKRHTSAMRNEMETAGYGLLHWRGSYEWDQVRIDFGVENLLDRLYYHPLGGTYTGQGKTMSGTGVAWGTPVPGKGRSIYGAVNIAF